ncbi:Protein-tyrosine-phosphatase IBR5 [Capsicum annuum]|nr:Protein-tyrosine-phosphatase IBR5 [Capsicum annuum]
MRKRERENPCGICGHYHKYEEGEVCGICGHRMPDVSDKGSTIQVSAFPSEILPEFLYLGSYDNASRAELLKTLGISRILNIQLPIKENAKIAEINQAFIRVYAKIAEINQAFIRTVPACQNLYKNSFTYHCLQDDRNLAFDDAIQFLEQCEKDRARVLVHCMLETTILNCIRLLYAELIELGYFDRSAAIVIAYLMKSKGWNLAQSLQWAKERRPSVDLNQEVYQQLQEYEKKIFASLQNQPSPVMPAFPSPVPSFNFGFPKPSDPIPAPAFNSSTARPLFSRPAFEVPPHGFTFGAAHNQHNDANQNPNGSDVAMDGS